MGMWNELGGVDWFDVVGFGEEWVGDGTAQDCKERRGGWDCGGDSGGECSQNVPSPAQPSPAPASHHPLPVHLQPHQTFYHFDVITTEKVDTDGILLPISLLVGLLTSFRITDAFGKWNRASGLVLTMHR